MCLFPLMACAFVLFFASCKDDNNDGVQNGEAYEYWVRGRDYDGKQQRLAEYYFQKSYEAYREDPSQDWIHYADAGYRAAYLRANRFDTEGALAIITEMLALADTQPDFPPGPKGGLLTLMAECQLQLHQYDACRSSCQKTYEAHLAVDNRSSSGDNANTIITCYVISDIHYRMGDLDEAQRWLDEAEHLLTLYRQSGHNPSFAEEWTTPLALRRALYQHASGHTTEAAATYASIPASRFRAPLVLSAAADYAMAAGRYDEAARWYERFDSTFAATDGAQLNFETIAQRLNPRYTAYRKGGHSDRALALADSLSAAIDSALVWQKKSDAAELSVIYQTNEKDLQLARQQFTISRHRIIVASLVVILLLIGYFLWRSARSAGVLAAKNRVLYEQVQQLEKAESRQREQAEAQPAETLGQNQLLYRRLCELMENPDVYTDAATNHETLARLLGTNRTYLGEALRECAGLTTADFLNQHRIRHAARLLATTNDPVGDIIEQSGITSRSTFARLFQEHYSMSPSEYRRAAGTITKTK